MHFYHLDKFKQTPEKSKTKKFQKKTSEAHFNPKYLEKQKMKNVHRSKAHSTTY